MKKSTLFPTFKLYYSNVHFCHRLHLLPPFKKMDKVRNVTIFMTLNIRQQGQRCLRNREKQGEPDCPACCPERVSSRSAGGGEQAVWMSFPQLRNGAGSPSGPRGLMFTGKSKEKEKATEREVLDTNGLPSRTEQSNVQPMCTKKRSEGGERTAARTGKNKPQDKPRRAPVPKQGGKTA